MTALARYGWDADWQDRFDRLGVDGEPARVVRHDGVGLQVVTAADADQGVTRLLMLSRRLDPAPTVGDWIVVATGQPVAVLERRSLLRRRAALRDREQVLAANIETVLLVCGLDRPVKDGRIQRGAALATDSGATPIVILTKADLLDDPSDASRVAAEVAKTHPGLEVHVVSVREGSGVEALHALVDGRTVTLLGESGAGKSSIVNALLDDEVTSVGRVRAGDAKGRHTTTNRELHLVPGGGVLIDTPGIRSIGLYVEPDKVTESFADIDLLAESCRFSNCGHGGEPGCAVGLAVADGSLDGARVEAWTDLRAEAERSAQRKLEAERNRADRRTPGGPPRRRPAQGRPRH